MVGSNRGVAPGGNNSGTEELDMSANVKKWVNRGGLIAVIAGIVAIVVGGGDTSAALETAGTVATIAGAVAVLIREVFD